MSGDPQLALFDARRMFPVGPLVEFAGGVDAAREQLGISGATWRTMLAYGLTEVQADRYAVRLGTVPHLLWPRLWGEVCAA